MLFIEELFSSNPMPALMQIVIVIFSVCCHEYAHAQMALWQGDSTAADEGHLTLNPLKQMGVMSLFMLAFIGIAWGAVPVNPSRMRHRYSNELVALAGPLMNLILFVCFIFAFVVNAIWVRNEGMTIMFSLGGIINFVLFLFNMLPIPPLDGWTVSYRFIAAKINFHSEWVKGITIFLVLLVVIFSRYFFMAGQLAFGFGVAILAAVAKSVGLIGG